MSPTLRSLLIKDWNERRSHFLFAFVFLMGLVGYCVAYEMEYRTRAFIAGYYHSCLILGQLGSVFLAMNVVAGEYSKRTIKFSTSLPVSLSNVGWSRLIVAWSCLVIPMLLGGLIATLLLATGLIEQAGLRSDTVRLPERSSLPKVEAIGFLWTTIAVAAGCGLQLVSILSWLGTRCRKEGTVGSIGVILILFSQIFTVARHTLDSMGMYLASDWIGGVIPNSLLISWGYSDLDGSTYSDLDLAPLVIGPLVMNILITLAVAWRFSNQYGRRGEGISAKTSRWRKGMIPIPNLLAWLPIPPGSQIGALIWLNARESIPISLAGLFIAAAIAVIGRFLDHSSVSDSFTHFRGALPENTWFVGILWGAVVAVSIFGSDLRQNLEQFWRSRPISPTKWFWVKFIVGLIAVLGALDGIPALIAWNVPYAGTRGRMGFVYLACMPLIHAQSYTIAVAAICKLRRPILAAMIAVMMFFVFEGVIQSIPVQSRLSTIAVYNGLNGAQAAGESLNLTSHGYPIVYGIVVVSCLIAVLLARRSIVQPIASKTALLLIIAALFGVSDDARGDDSEIVKEVIAGFRTREAVVKDIHLRFTATRHRTDTFYKVQSAAAGPAGRRPRNQTISSLPPSDEEFAYELFERLPRRTWTTFGPNKTLKSRTAFDGATQRDYTTGIKRAAQGTISSATQGSRPPTIDPDLSLMGNGGIPLIGILERSQLQQATRSDLNGEQLIDLIVTTQFSDGANSSVNIGLSKHEITVNVTRNYWPIRVRHSHKRTSESDPFSIIEIAAEGWIDAELMVYPRHVIQKAFVSLPTFAEKPTPSVRTSTNSAPELSETQEVEITKIALNTDFSDTVFTPAFPPATVVYDLRNGKQFESDANGDLHPYAPQPAGLRGAVFIYHLIWISMAVTYLFIRRTEPASANTSEVVSAGSF